MGSNVVQLLKSRFSGLCDGDFNKICEVGSLYGGTRHNIEIYD